MNSFVQSDLHPLPLGVCVVETKAGALIGRVEWSWSFVRVDFAKEKTKSATAHPWELVRFDDVVSIRALSAEESRPYVRHHGTHGSKTHPERLARGERSGVAKINEEQVRALRREFNETRNISEAARRVGVPRGAAKCAIQGKTWRHVT